MVYCADNRLSFVQARIDTIASTPDTLARVDINFEYTARDAEPLGLGLNPHHYNYYLAHCPEGVTLTPSYNRVVYPGLYENTDLHVSGNNSWMKFEFVIHPGGDPEDITMTIAGADNVVLIEQLGLVIVTSSLGNYVFPRPDVFRIGPDNEYYDLGWQPDWTLTLTGDTLRFTSIGSYDPEEVLVFRLGEELMADPAHVGQPEWSTQFGGNGLDEAMDVSTDTEGNVYMCGFTSSSNFPTNNGVITVAPGDLDAFIAKFGSANGAMAGVVPDGDRLMWATYWGGTGSDKALALKATGTGTGGKTYITGGSTSSDFPPNIDGVYQQSNANASQYAFVVGIDNQSGGDPDAGYVWSTLFGGSGNDIGHAITTDASGNIYIGGLTTTSAYAATTCGVPQDAGFPKCNTSSSFNNGNAYGGGASDGFIARFSTAGALQWSSFYGGAERDAVNDLAFDGSSRLYITGETGSDSDFPVLALTGGSYAQPYGGGASDAFAARFNASLTHEYCSYIGGGGADVGNAIAIRSNGTVAIGGSTSSDVAEDDWCETEGTGLFPACGNGHIQAVELDAVYGGGDSDGFILELGNCYITWATYYGGPGNDRITDLAVDYRDYLFFVGETNGTASSNVYQAPPGDAGGWLDQSSPSSQPYSEGFMGIMDDSRDRLYSTYFGFSRVERCNAITTNTVSILEDYYWYIAGFSDSPGFENKLNLSDPDNNVWHCCDNGWQQAPSGYPNNPGNAFITRFNWYDTFMSVEDMKEVESGLNVNAYPNPTDHALTLQVDLTGAERIQIRLHSMTGQQLSYRDHGMQQGRFSTSMDVSALAPGIYFVQISAGDRQVTKKIIKHR